MLPLDLKNTPELLQMFAERARARRLELNLTQRGLAERSGVSLGSLKRFERTGLVSFESLLKIAMALDALRGFESIFKAPEFKTLDEVLQNEGPTRKRGRIS